MIELRISGFEEGRAELLMMLLFANKMHSNSSGTFEAPRRRVDEELFSILYPDAKELTPDQKGLSSSSGGEWQLDSFD